MVFIEVLQLNVIISTGALQHSVTEGRELFSEDSVLQNQKVLTWIYNDIIVKHFQIIFFLHTKAVLNLLKRKKIENEEKI